LACDEAILSAVAAGLAPPTLRFFGWTPACLSLGYAQPVADVDLARLNERGWGLVRRPTGGRAILHVDELTYSVIAPMDEPRVLGGVVESYRQLSQGLLRGLELLGLAARADRKPGASSALPESHAPLPVCFEVPSDYEITANGQKLLGSAQVRKRGVVLQHGTLPLFGDIARICEALRFESEAERERVRARVHGRATTLEAVLGRIPAWREAAEAVGQGFAQALNVSFEAGGLAEYEQEQMSRLRADKYAAEAWNVRC
jgi:lipoate-protein ligase A